MLYKINLIGFCIIIGWFGWACGAETTSEEEAVETEDGNREVPENWHSLNAGSVGALIENNGETEPATSPSLGASHPALNGSSNNTVTNDNMVTNSSDDQKCDLVMVSQVFRYALCSCNDTNIIGTLNTDAFDSDDGPFISGSELTGAAIGTNGTLTYVGFADIGGSLTVADQQGFAVPGSVQVRGDLRVQGPFSYVGLVDVTNNCWLGSGSVGVGDLHIAGNLTTSTMGSINIPNLTATVGGNTVTQPVTIQQPCACGDNELVNITEIIKDAKAQNDNQKTGFDPTSLSSAALEFRTVELPARAFATNINIAGSLTLVVHQKSTLFVEGDVISSGFLTLEMDPQSDLDLIVGGNLVITGIDSFGNPARPAKVRVYVEGDQEITITGITKFAGNLYAPHANVMLTGIQDYYGALFANNITAIGDYRFLYDSAIIREGNDCDVPNDDPDDSQCDVCTDCEATSGCVDGQCGECLEDADCCEPLVCVNGACVPILI